MGGQKTKIRKRFLYACYLVVITIAMLEILLHFYYPFQRKIRGDKWQLSTNIVYHLNNKHNPRLDKSVINKRNSLGFRGEDPSNDINNRLTILTVGGSTTACTYLTEGKTWTDRLGANLQRQFSAVWINNAGLDGHSTYGHLNFLYYYLPALSFKPKVILFLIGANDVDRNDLSSIDTSLQSQNKIKSWLECHSEVVNFFVDLKWLIHPVDIFKNTPNWSFSNAKNVHHSRAYIDSALQKQDTILHAFRKRLYSLINQCFKNDVVPVFVTQPLVFGDPTQQGGNPAIDFKETLENENGQLFWEKLALFNNVTTQVSIEKKIHCIDLAGLMPKDTLYYYDMVHYTNAGAEEIGDIIFENLNQYLAQQFPQYLKH